MDRDAEIRSVAFQKLAALSSKYAGAIPWAEIAGGFLYEGEQVFFSGKARGIFRPKQMRRGVLSIKTTVPRQGRQRRYDDLASDEGFFLYRFQGEDPMNADNRALREAWEDQSPLVYLHGIAPSVYQATVPVFISDWRADELTVHVVPGQIQSGSPVLPKSEDLRRYSVIQAKQRLHQAVFRELVIEAYKGRCAVSGLPEKRLLHAAHIVPDRDERGLPVVTNGIAMSVLHHTAYDLNLLGISPEGIIHINTDLLEIHDGPTLRHALQELDGTPMRFPDDPQCRPDPDFLAERFDQFRAA